MKRRKLLGIGAISMMTGISGCAEQVEGIVNETENELEEEAEQRVEDELDGLSKPPDADVIVDEEEILVTSIGSDTVGVICGFPDDGDNITENIESMPNAIESVGSIDIDDCPEKGNRIVAVNKVNDIEVIEKIGD